MTTTPPKPTPIQPTCQCQRVPISDTLTKLEAKVHRHSTALEQALAEIRELLKRDDENERRAA